MALLQRLTGIDYLPTQGLPIQIAPFFAMLRERLRLKITNQQLVDAFALTADDQNDLRAFVRRVHDQGASYELPAGRGGIELLEEAQDVVTLGEQGVAPYTTLAAIQVRLIGG